MHKKKIRNKLRQITRKDFIPAVLLMLLMASLTWGARIAVNDVSREDTATAARLPLPTVRPNLDVLLVAHRGVKLYAPENTIPAILKAIELGYDYVELDVHYSRDGVPVMMHDEEMSRTTSRTDFLSFIPLSEIKKADAGSWFGKQFAGTRVPTLEECLQVMKGRIALYLDQKDNPRPITVALLDKYGFDEKNLVLVEDAKTARLTVKEFGSDAPLLIGVASVESIEPILKEFPSTVAFNTNCNGVTPEFVDAAHERGIKVFANAMLDIPAPRLTECFRSAINAGVDAIQIDNPDVFFPLIEKMRAENAKK